MICHQRKLLYIHIPKTGGNSVNTVLHIGWEKHKDLARYVGENAPGLLDEYFVFCVVRNPWARLFSDFNYQRHKSRGVKLHVHDSRGKKRSFPNWVEAVFDDPFQYSDKDWGGQVSPNIHRWSPQCDWLKWDGKIRLNHLVRLENLGQDIQPVLAGIGRPDAKLPHKNRRLHLPYWWFYNRKLADRVGEYYEEDIRAFGYSFRDKRKAEKLKS